MCRLLNSSNAKPREASETINLIKPINNRLAWWPGFRRATPKIKRDRNSNWIKRRSRWASLEKKSKSLKINPVNPPNPGPQRAANQYTLAISEKTHIGLRLVVYLKFTRFVFYFKLRPRGEDLCMGVII